MASTAEVVSLALIRIGLKPIASMEDAVPRAAAARLEFQPAVDQVLFDHKWKFSLERAALAQAADPPLYGFAFAFQLPTDPYCLRVWSTSLDPSWAYSLGTVGLDTGLLDERGASAWQVEGRQLLANVASLSILYTRRVTDTTLFDPGFTSALVYCLASRLAYPLTGKAPLGADMRRLYEIEVARAKGADSQQASARSGRSRFLTDCR